MALPEKSEGKDQLFPVQATFIRRFYQMNMAEENINNWHNASARLLLLQQSPTQDVGPEIRAWRGKL